MTPWKTLLEAARTIALSLGTVIAVTGERDLVTDGSRFPDRYRGPLVKSGTLWETGCVATVIVAAFLSREKDPVTATAAALAFFGLAGERAAESVEGPGSFWVNVIDQLYKITPAELEQTARISAA